MDAEQEEEERRRMRRRATPRKDQAQKVLLSIVDPWDVKVASVDPVCLAGRRGVGPDRLELRAPEHPHRRLQPPPVVVGPPQPRARASDSGSSPASARTPWPWYKPAAGPQCPPDSSASPSDARPTAPAPADVPIKPFRAEDKQHQRKNDVKQSRSPVDGPVEQVETNRRTSPKPRDDNVETLDTALDGTNICESDRPIHRASRPQVSGEKVLRTVAVSDNGARPSDESLVFLVEDLVRSRYNWDRTIHRKLARKPLPLSPSTNQTGKNENPKILSNNFQTTSLKNVKANVDVASTDQERNLVNKIREHSLSMPLQLDDMDELRIGNDKGTASKFRRTESDSSVTFSNSGSTLNGSTLGSETEEEENEEESSTMPLQSPARQAAGNVSTPTNSSKMANDRMEFPNGQSTNSTITSVNSISSLLKEKLQWTIPQALRSSKKRQNADYRLRGFVGFLFLCIVFLVGFAHVYYTQHVLQRAYFDKFRFNKNERLMHVYNSAGVDIIAARLGVGIPSETGVFPCLPQHQRPDKVCLEWLQHSRLYLSHTKRDMMNCYHITWQSLNPAINPKDCFDWSPKRGHWYGAGQIQNMAYPLEQGRLEPSPFVTGDIRKHPFGNVLKRYFLNSKGATITVDPETPLYVSINSTQNKELCLMAKHDAFAYINHLTPFPKLNYSICATDNMKNLHSLMAEKFLWDGLKPDELQAIHSLLTEPVWQISPTNEADIYNYTEDVIALGFLRQGHVLLSEEWQPSSGDLVLDETRFKSMKETIDVIHRRGFRIVFTVQPFISTESENFKDAVKNRLLISERGSDPRIPALTRYRQVNSAAVLDITNNKTLPWLQSKLEPLMDKYHVDSFYLDLGTAHDMPHYYKCEQPLTNPDHYKTLFVNSILGLVPVIGVSSAIARPRAPVFVSLPPFPSSWKAIKTVIPTVLSYGIIGYSFVMPGAVGGDVALPMSDNNPDNDFEVNLPDKELYIRWLQLSTFLPVIRFTHLPSKYSDESVLEIAKSLTTLRQKTVTPLLKKYANVTLDTGLPIIRPLWMLDPGDPACHLVMDEFSVGEELIVAPIIHSGSRQREVYLPAGVWKDGIDKSLRKGSRWIHNYRVAEDKIAYFVKMPDDMRF